LVVANGGADGTGGLLSANVILELRHEQTSGANFDWNLRYQHPAGSSPFNGFVRTSPIVGPSGTRDDAWHKYTVELTPSTITGSFSAGPTLGSAVVNTDGRIRVLEDDAVIMDATGLQFVVNPHPLTGNALYYGRGVWHGYADLPGPFTLPLLEGEVTTSDIPPIPNGGECCGPDPLPGDPDPGDTPEPPDYMPLPEFLSECDGPGLVPEGGQGVISADNWNY